MDDDDLASLVAASASPGSPRVCTDRRTVERELVEGNVLGAVRTRLMAPEIYAAFARAP